MQQTDPRPDPSLGAARSGRLIIGTQALRLAVRVGGTVSLARLVSPSEYGIYGMAAAVHGLVYVFQDFGLATVTLRHPELSERDRNSLFWINALFGAVLSLVVAACGVPVAAFFGEPTLRTLLPVMGTTFFVNGLHTQLRAQLARDHRFSELNRIEIEAFTVSTALAVLAAWLGAGAWALAIMMLTAEVVLALGMWRCQSWRPGRWSGLGEAWHLLGSGAGLSFNDSLRFVQRNADQFVIGKWLGAGPLGLYGRAAQVAALPALYVADPLANLVISTLRRLGAEREKARLFWTRLVTDLAWIAMPCAAIFAGLSRELIGFLLGERWILSAEVLRGLSPAVAFLPLQMACGWAFMARGTRSRMLGSSALSASLLLASCFLLRNAGLAYLAAGVGAAGAVGALSSLAFMRPSDAASPMDGLRAMTRPTATALALLAILSLVLRSLAERSLPVRLISGCATLSVFTCLILLGWPAARAELRGHFLVRRQ